MSEAAAASPDRLGEVARLFGKLGLIAFGGPAAHIAMMHDEVVARRRWLDDQHFLDLIGATSLIPGPNSTEMTIHLGYLRAGWRGLIVAGTCFILPAATIVLILAWLYDTYSTLPTAGWLLYGIKPVVVAIIAQALWLLGRKAVKGPLTAGVGLAVTLLYFWGWNIILLLLLAGVTVMLVKNRSRLRSAGGAGVVGLPFGLPLSGGLSRLGLAQEDAPVNLLTLFLTFLKIGSLLYGSGYVLLAFLRSDLVVNLGWLTDQQLLDAVAIGQLTPGPVFTTATFIGYLIAGFPGAVLATVGIFLPSFFFVAVSNPFIPRLRRSPWAGSLLDGVNVASLGLMAAVTWQLGIASVVDPLTAAMTVVALVLLVRYKVNTTWLILGAAAMGWGVGRLWSL
ncbi:MAG: chromate efflux transporter [Anaerolineae bacterium]|nr:chromate efflux transporter [Anaerolineae bacterium]MCB0225421.1 chromate efflux transporter [Anaerolineae bacterium]